MQAGNARKSSARTMRISRAALALAIGALLAAAVAGPGHRTGLWDYQGGFAILGIASLCALTACVLGIVAVMRGGSRLARTLALAASLIGLLVAGLPLQQLYLAKSLPLIHDISTDTADPPPFVAVVPLRVDAPNPVAYQGEQAARLQRDAYPQVAPRFYPAGRQAVFDAALALSRARGWAVHAAEPAEGRIEASATSAWFGFVDDLVIRVADSPQGTRVDMRSKSRVGRSDLGANARRIEAFLADLDAAVGRAP